MKILSGTLQFSYTAEGQTGMLKLTAALIQLLVAEINGSS
jgi:hypothetical protein